LENLKQKNLLSVLGVSEVQWKGQGEISGVYTVIIPEVKVLNSV
jgi:hypothetical protein